MAITASEQNYAGEKTPRLGTMAIDTVFTLTGLTVYGQHITANVTGQTITANVKGQHITGTLKGG